jgi:type I restriction enzyme S subunit
MTVLPADWKEIKVGDCLTIMHGKNQSQIVNPEGKYPILATGGVIGRTNSYLSNKPSVLIGRKGTIDRPQYIDTPFWTVDTLFYSEVKKGNSAKFLFYKFLMVDWKQYNEASGVPSLNASTIENVEMMMPPLKEQEVIADALSDADIAIESLDALVAKKRDLKQATMQQLLTGRTRLPGFTADWKEVRLGDLGSFSKGAGIKKDDVVSAGVPCVRYGQLYTEHDSVIRSIRSFVSTEVASTSRPLVVGEILFAGSGETKAEIGKCVAYVDGIGAVAGGDLVILTPKQCSSIFLGYALNSPEVVRQKMARAQGDAVVHISAASLATVVVDLPSLKEQEAIGEALTVMDDELEVLTEQVSKLRMVKEGMMQDLLTGKVRLV